MPLLRQKYFTPAKPLGNKAPNQTIYTISHSQEQFTVKEEYLKRLALYNEEVWTCQCTGHVNLTHKMAYESEIKARENLNSQFNSCFEKPVLEIVHHSTEILDVLVDKSWLCLHQAFVPEEEVIFKIKDNGKTVTGNVVSVDRQDVEVTLVNGCHSPSSDKENNSTDNVKKPLDGGSPKKWVPPKVLPYKYSVKIKKEEKIIHGVPASDLGRAGRGPSKDLLRLFIRASAVRYGSGGPGSPWVVDTALTVKYSIPNKFAEFMVSPQKMMELSKKAQDEMLKKRKNVTSHQAPVNKKAKLDKKSSKSPSKQKSISNSPKKQRTLFDTTKKSTKSPKKPTSGSPKKKTSKKLCMEIVDVDSSDSEDELSLAKLKESVACETDSDVVLLDLKKKSPKKRQESDDDDDDDVVLSKVKMKSPTKKATTTKKSKSSPSKMSKNDSKLHKKKKNKEKEKKGMKQPTLFDLSKKLKASKTKSPTKQKTPVNSPRKSPAKPTTPRTPLIVKKIQKTIQEKNIAVRRQLLWPLVKKACNDLTEKQRNNLPDDVRDIIILKYEKIAEAKKLKSMTPEERDAYFTIKRKHRMLELREQRIKQNKRYEDNELTDIRPLPIPTIVPTPDGLPNECFGDVIMVTEFFQCFQHLLTPDIYEVIQADILMEALVTGPKGFWYVSKLLVYLLQTLLQDQIAEDYSELEVDLSEIPVNSFTSSELVRLCLRKHDIADSHSDSSLHEASGGGGGTVEVDGGGTVEVEDEVDEEIIELLENSELYDLDPIQKLQILVGLCQRIMASYSLQDYIEAKQKEATALWRQRQEHQQKKNQKEKELKEKKKVELAIEFGIKHGTNKTSNNMWKNKILMTQFYGKSVANDDKPSSSAEEGVDSTTDDTTDLATIVKRRRLNTAEKEKREKEEKLRKDKEYEEYMEIVAREKLEKEFEAGILQAKLCQRQSCLGCDRSHNRYWAFTNSVPGLYVEKGWVTKDIDYKYVMRYVKVIEDEEFLEKTFPHSGQNLWFKLDSEADIQQLIDNLHPFGIRESLLKKELQSQQKSIIASLQKNVVPQILDGEGWNDMVEGLKKELKETTTRLVNGCMGGIDDMDRWIERLDAAKDVKELGSMLIETQMSVDPKFLEGIFYVKNDESRNEPSENKELTRWMEAVETCTTMSRLHVLLGMLDSCIKWEKSVENAKCKICRKNKKDNYSALIVCDKCNQAFHLICLRPALLTVPSTEWFCPVCVPRTPRNRERTKRYHEESSDDDDEYDEDEDSEYSGGKEKAEKKIQNENTCTRCGGDEGLVCCNECPRAFHLECHDPPLRHAPRSGWTCQCCKQGIPYRKKRPRKTVEKGKTSGSKGKQKPVQQRKLSTDYHEFESTDDDIQQKTSSRRRAVVKTSRSRRSASNSRKNYAEVSENEDASSEDKEEEDEDEEEEFEVKKISPRQNNKKRSSPPQKPAKRSSKGRLPSNESEIEIKDTKKSQERLQAIFYEIVNRLIKNRQSWPFREPVNRQEVPDYFEIIKKPIDLSEIESKCLHYESITQFTDDFLLLFNNAELYNKPNSEVYKCMAGLEKHYVQMIERHLPEVKYKRKFKVVV